MSFRQLKKLNYELHEIMKFQLEIQFGNCFLLFIPYYMEKVTTEFDKAFVKVTIADKKINHEKGKQQKEKKNTIRNI